MKLTLLNILLLFKWSVFVILKMSKWCRHRCIWLDAVYELIAYEVIVLTFIYDEDDWHHW